MKTAPPRFVPAFLLLVSLVLAPSPRAYGAGTCDATSLQPAVKAASSPIRETFAEVAKIVAEHKDELRAILSRFNSHGGTEFEIAQVEHMLKHAPDIELWHLENVKPLKSTAVYASTNVPLYTFVAHGVVPMTVSEKVWFRTPETTRQVYVELAELFRKYGSAGRFDRLQILTDPQDVQYDNFRKMFVLGLNRKGKRREEGRFPAELVVFTGNPDTAGEILKRTEEKIEEKPELFPAFRQLFLGFGAGMNPVVITPDAAQQIDRTVDLILQPARMNAGQDCMVPNFYMVHEALLPKLMPRLLERIKGMKAGANQDAHADYTTLELTKDFTKLERYRQEYLAYLKTPDATIDSEKHLVSPHVFVLPLNEFKEATLQEHYGPFFTIFPYRTLDDIKEVAMDNRVQTQAMYAVVMGGKKASRWMNETQRIFQQRRHSVIMNDGLFTVEAGNQAFGGLGPKSSILHTLTKTEDGRVFTNSGHHPTLISEELFKAFGTRTTPGLKLARDASFYVASLKDAVHSADLPAASLPTLAPGWAELQAPQAANRATGLVALRDVIGREGFFRFLLQPRGDGAHVQAMQKFFGNDFVFTSDFPPQDAPVQGKGVVMHPASIGTTVPSLNRYRGTVNPHLGRGLLLGLLDSNKLTEYRTAEAIHPGIMARSETFADLRHIGAISPEFFREKAQVEALLAETLKAAQAGQAPAEGAHERLEHSVAELVDHFFSDVREYFPEGAYFKNYGEFATADLGTQVTSFGSLSKQVAGQFVRRFFTALDNPGKSASPAAPEFKERMNEDPWEMSTKFVNALLYAPEDLMAQGRVPIAKTELGFPMEFRVDFMDGETVMSKLRFSHEYLPEEAEEAGKVLSDFFKNAPPEFRHLPGGADVARLTDGSWRIIEFNYGSNSGSLWPQYFPVDANVFTAKLTGKNTPFLTDLETVYQGGLAGQREFLKSRRHEREQWWKETLEDFSLAEGARWLRNRYLDDFARDPSAEKGAWTMAQIRSLYENLASPENEDLEKLQAGAENYVRRKQAQLPPSFAAGASGVRSLGGAPVAKSLALPGEGVGGESPRSFRLGGVPISRGLRSAIRDSDVGDVPGWPHLWMKEDIDLAPAKLVAAYLAPAVVHVARSGQDSATINQTLEALYHLGKSTVQAFSQRHEQRYEPAAAIRLAITSALQSHTLSALTEAALKETGKPVAGMR